MIVSPWCTVWLDLRGRRTAPAAWWPVWGCLSTRSPTHGSLADCCCSVMVLNTQTTLHGTSWCLPMQSQLSTRLRTDNHIYRSFVPERSCVERLRARCGSSNITRGKHELDGPTVSLSSGPFGGPFCQKPKIGRLDATECSWRSRDILVKCPGENLLCLFSPSEGRIACAVSR